MKKHFLFWLLLTLFHFVSSQTNISFSSIENLRISNDLTSSPVLNQKQVKNNYNGWLFPTDIATNLNNGYDDFYTPYIQYIWPDSCAVIVNNGVKTYPWMHSAGYTFDARSIGFDENLQQAPISGLYSVDSITIGALYEYRNNKFDTLLIEVGAVNINNTVSLKSLMLGTSDTILYPLSTNSIGTQQFGVGTSWNNPNKLTIKYVLTQNDTTNQYLKFIKIPLPSPITVGIGQVLGVNITFVPGTQYQIGDTIKVNGGQTPKKLNSFGIYYMRAYQANGAAFYDRYGKNLFNYNDKRTRYQIWTAVSILNQCLYPDAWGSSYIGFKVTPIITHSINFSVYNGNGSLNATANSSPINSGDDVPAGQNLVFTANPNTDFIVREWKRNGTVVSGNNSNVLEINNILSNTNVTVEFRHQNSSLLTFGVNGGNGSVFALINGVNTLTNSYIENGNNIVFTATPTAGYRIKNWKLNNNIISGNTSNSYELTDIQQDSDVKVEFEQITYTISYSVIGGNGSLVAIYNSNTVSNNAQIPQGANVEFIANPLPSHQVKEWKLNNNVVVGNTSNTLNINNLLEDINVTVEYEERSTYDITFSVVGGNGSILARVDGINITSGSTILANKDIIFTAIPNSNYGVKEWRLNNSIIQGNTSNTFSIVNLQENSDVTVEFRVDDVGISNNETSSIHIFPNPSTAIFYIQSDHQYKMEIIDIQGRILINKQIEKGLNELDMSIHNDGVYFMRLSNSEGMHVLKINKMGN